MSGIVGHMMYAVLADKAARQRKLPVSPMASVVTEMATSGPAPVGLAKVTMASTFSHPKANESDRLFSRKFAAMSALAARAAIASS